MAEKQGGSENEGSFEDKKRSFFVRLALKYRDYLSFHDQSGQTVRDSRFGKETYIDLSGNKKERSRRWGDPTEHCLVEAAVAELAADMCGLSETEKQTLAAAAFLHDWRKRGEIEETRGESNPKKIEDSHRKSKNIILESGIENAEKITHLIESVGHTSLPKFAKLNADNSIVLRDDVSDSEMIMHYIDDITRETDIVTLDERMDYLEGVAAERYPYNEEGKKIWGGRTFFQAQREIGHLIEQKLAEKIKIDNPKELPNVFREKLLDKINMSGDI